MRRLLFVPAIAIAAWTIGSTAWSFVDVATTETIHRTYRFASVTGVVADNDGGSIEVVADRTEGAVVDVTRRQGIQDATVSVRVDDDGRVVVRSRCPAINTVCKVTATVHVPRGTPVTGGRSGTVRVTRVGGPVDLRTSSGTITVTGANGAVTARTDEGRIRVVESNGDLDLHTGTGRIDVENVRARRISAVTGNGRVAISVLDAPDHIEARSTFGRLTILLPADAPEYAVETTNNVGSISTPIRTNPDAPRRIVAVTATGSISIRYR